MGAGHPIVVQIDDHTDTADIAGTTDQAAALARAGSELVRVTVNNDQAAQAVPRIVESLERAGVRVPIVGDFHYNGHILLRRYRSAPARWPSNPHQSRQRQHRPEE